MSTLKPLTLLTTALGEFRQRPAFFAALSASYVLFLWTQDILPIAGPLLSSLATTLLTARLFSVDRRPRLLPLLALAGLSFPINMLWTILFSLNRNTSWSAAMSSGWTLPVLFFMCLVLASLARSIRLIVLEGAGVDRSLSRGWTETSKHWRSVMPLCLLMAVLFTLSMATMGIGFAIAAPLGVVLLKATAEDRS